MKSSARAEGPAESGGVGDIEVLETLRYWAQWRSQWVHEFQ